MEIVDIVSKLGSLGIIAIVFPAVIYWMMKTIDRMQKDYMEAITEFTKVTSNHISHNTDALNKLICTLERIERQSDK